MNFEKWKHLHPECEIRAEHVHEEHWEMICSGHVGAQWKEAGVREPEFHRAGQTVRPVQRQIYVNEYGILCEEKVGQETRAQEGQRRRELRRV